MKKYTVVLVRDNDSCMQPRVLHIRANTPDEAEKEANFSASIPGHGAYTVIAIFAGHHESL